MKKIGFGLSALVLSAAAVLIACESDDVTEGPADGGDDASPFDGSLPDAAPSDGAVSDAGPVRPPWALLTINYSDQSDMAAFSLDAAAVDGVLNYATKYGATSIAADGPWELEQGLDLVEKLDPNVPWHSLASWNVAGTDSYDGGQPYSDPVKVVAGPTGKDYVIRFNRNQIAVIDPTKTGSGISPTKFIDLSSYLDPTDEDGAIDMVSAVYVASQHRLLVLLGNLDLFNTDPLGFFTLCGTTHSEIVAIDTDTDALVSASDGGATAAPVLLGGFNGVALLNDVTRNRLLAISAGCNDPGPPDAGTPGPTHMREIDTFDLSTGATTVALDLDSNGYPGEYAFTDATHVAIGFDFGASANLWDVTTNALGASLPNAPGTFTYDGQGNLFGASTSYFADGGSATSLVSMRLDDGGVTTFGPAPFRNPTGFFESADLWAP